MSIFQELQLQSKNAVVPSEIWIGQFWKRIKDSPTDSELDQVL